MHTVTNDVEGTRTPTTTLSTPAPLPTSQPIAQPTGQPPTIDRDEVLARRDTLERARRALKTRFVGIDAIIDQLCDAITVWYTMPQVLTRPVIVNLWGMTGVGKTDLIRQLVACLDVREHFIEIELSNNDKTTFHTSVASRLEDSGALIGQPTVLLFDEVQRFNTLDAHGQPLPVTKFSDFWELLSDGRLSRRDRDDIDAAIGRLRFAAKQAGSEPGESSTEVGWWDQLELSRQYGVTSAGSLSYREAIRQLDEIRSTKRMFEPIDCSKCLVVISGNLDEAYPMAGCTDEVDVDADIFHAFSRKITMVDIKRALARRFKPEQVARFGNTHLIYPSLRRADFVELIGREIARIRRSTLTGFGITLTVSPAVADLIYRNGVFPVQGTRPVFSSIADLLETNVAKLVFAAVLDGVTEIALDYDLAGRQLVAVIGPAGRQQVVTMAVPGAIDRIRESGHADKVACVAVHEAGHALVYALRFGLAPLQLTARVADSHTGGFSFGHDLFASAAGLRHEVEVDLAGGVAEEVVFGRDLASAGRGQDLTDATKRIIDHQRRYGFDPRFPANYLLDEPYDLRAGPSSTDIEALLHDLTHATRALLVAHRRPLLALAAALVDKGRLTAEQVRNTLAQYGIRAGVEREGFQWCPPYADRLAAALRSTEEVEQAR